MTQLNRHWISTWRFCQIMVVHFSEYMNFTLSIYTFLQKGSYILRAELGFSSCEKWDEGENLKNQTLYAFRHPLMLVEIFTRFLFWLLILWGNTVCAINLSLPSSIFFRYFVYFVKDFSFSPFFPLRFVCYFYIESPRPKIKEIL